MVPGCLTNFIPRESLPHNDVIHNIPQKSKVTLFLARVPIQVMKLHLSCGCIFGDKVHHPSLGFHISSAVRIPNCAACMPPPWLPQNIYLFLCAAKTKIIFLLFFFFKQIYSFSFFLFPSEWCHVFISVNYKPRLYILDHKLQMMLIPSLHKGWK